MSSRSGAYAYNERLIMLPSDRSSAGAGSPLPRNATNSGTTPPASPSPQVFGRADSSRVASSTLSNSFGRSSTFDSMYNSDGPPEVVRRNAHTDGGAWPAAVQAAAGAAGSAGASRVASPAHLARGGRDDGAVPGVGVPLLKTESVTVPDESRGTGLRESGAVRQSNNELVASLTALPNQPSGSSSTAAAYNSGGWQGNLTHHSSDHAYSSQGSALAHDHSIGDGPNTQLVQASFSLNVSPFAPLATRELRSEPSAPVPDLDPGRERQPDGPRWGASESPFNALALSDSDDEADGTGGAGGSGPVLTAEDEDLPTLLPITDGQIAALKPLTKTSVQSVQSPLSPRPLYENAAAFESLRTGSGGQGDGDPMSPGAYVNGQELSELMTLAYEEDDDDSSSTHPVSLNFKFKNMPP